MNMKMMMMIIIIIFMPSSTFCMASYTKLHHEDYNEVKSGDLGGHTTGPPRSVHFSGQCSSRTTLTKNTKTSDKKQRLRSYLGDIFTTQVKQINIAIM
jgi:hypothetical protein